jgi:hypothetical protein
VWTISALKQYQILPHAYVMTNDTLINLLAWCKRERETLQIQQEMLQSGRLRIFETDESGQRDISNQHFQQSQYLLNWIGSLSDVVASS